MFIFMSAYRSTQHPATGYTPNMLMLGREVLLPSQIIFPLPPKQDDQNPDSYVSLLKSKLEEVYHTARQNLQKPATRQNKNYDTRVSQLTYKIGSLVYKYNDCFKKLNERWSGPFLVTKILSPVLYEIRNRYKSQVVHHDKLKHYNSEDVPVWVDDMKNGLQL